MHPLDERGRRRLLSWSALLCAVPVCLTPLAARSSFELASERAHFNARFTAPPLGTTWTQKPVVVVRDPFVPEGRPVAVVVAPRTGSTTGMHVTQGEPIGYVASGSAAISTSVTAVVTGASPRALIDDGLRVRVVAIGDALLGSRVARIDRSGVRLQNGTLLPLTAGTP